MTDHRDLKHSSRKSAKSFQKTHLRRELLEKSPDAIGAVAAVCRHDHVMAVSLYKLVMQATPSPPILPASCSAAPLGG
jgi:hypothetical protein